MLSSYPLAFPKFPSNILTQDGLESGWGGGGDKVRGKGERRGEGGGEWELLEKSSVAVNLFRPQSFSLKQSNGSKHQFRTASGVNVYVCVCVVQSTELSI